MFYATGDDATQVEIVENFLTPAECEQLIKANRSRVDEVVGPVRADTPIRKPNGAWHYPECRWRGSVRTAGEDQDLDSLDLDRVWNLVHHLNELEFRWRVPLFDGDGVGRFGISQYLPGDRMSAHVDDESREKPPYRVMHRGISMSVLLSDTDDFDGGGLRIFDGKAWHSPLAHAMQGTAVVFGSSTLHEVTEVRSGERWVFLAWIYNNHYQTGLR